MCDSLLLLSPDDEEEDEEHEEEQSSGPRVYVGEVPGVSAIPTRVAQALPEEQEGDAGMSDSDSEGPILYRDEEEEEEDDESHSSKALALQLLLQLGWAHASLCEVKALAHATPQHLAPSLLLRPKSSSLQPELCPPAEVAPAAAGAGGVALEGHGTAVLAAATISGELRC